MNSLHTDVLLQILILFFQFGNRIKRIEIQIAGTDGQGLQTTSLKKFPDALHLQRSFSTPTQKFLACQAVLP